jgi:hypothetical protein
VPLLVPLLLLVLVVAASCMLLENMRCLVNCLLLCFQAGVAAGLQLQEGRVARFNQGTKRALYLLHIPQQVT